MRKSCLIHRNIMAALTFPHCSLTFTGCCRCSWLRAAAPTPSLHLNRLPGASSEPSIIWGQLQPPPLPLEPRRLFLMLKNPTVCSKSGICPKAGCARRMMLGCSRNLYPALGGVPVCWSSDGRRPGEEKLEIQY